MAATHRVQEAGEENRELRLEVCHSCALREAGIDDDGSDFAEGFLQRRCRAWRTQPGFQQRTQPAWRPGRNELGGADCPLCEPDGLYKVNAASQLLRRRLVYVVRLSSDSPCYCIYGTGRDAGEHDCGERPDLCGCCAEVARGARAPGRGSRVPAELLPCAWGPPTEYEPVDEDGGPSQGRDEENSTAEVKGDQEQHEVPAAPPLLPPPPPPSRLQSMRANWGTKRRRLDDPRGNDPKPARALSSVHG